MSDTYNTIVSPAQVVSNGGPITRVKHSGDNSSTWKRGQLLEMVSGVIVALVDSSGSVAADLDTTDLTAVASNRLFIATTDLAAATDGKVAVQEILRDTILRAPLISTQAAQSTPPTAPESIVDSEYDLWQNGSGWFAPDKNATGTPMVVITGVEPEIQPFNHGDANIDMYTHSLSDPQRYNFVQFRFLSALFLSA